MFEFCRESPPEFKIVVLSSAAVASFFSGGRGRGEEIKLLRLQLSQVPLIVGGKILYENEKL